MSEADHSGTIAWKRQLYLLLALNTMNHIQYTGARFTVLLYAVHQQASPIVVGLLIALNSLFPAITSVRVGQVLDRRRDLRQPMLWVSVIMAAGVMLPALWDSLAALFIFCIVVGSNFNVFRIASQQLIGQYGESQHRPGNYTLYSQCLAIGNLIAPLMAGFAIDHVGFHFALLMFALLAVPPIAVFALNRIRLPQAPHPREQEKHGAGGAWDLLRIPRLRRVLIVGVVLATAWDIFTFIWPLYGTQLQFSASQIGLVAGVFYSGALVVRVLASLLLRRFSQWQLLLLSMASASSIYVIFPMLSSFMLLIVAAFILGLVLGIIQPMTMSLAYDEAPSNRKAEVIGLRMTLALGLHVVIPLLSGALGSALGLAPVYWAAAAMLLAGFWTARSQWHYRKT